jgi:hypothetical protein
VSIPRIAHGARFALRIRRVFQCISYFFALRERSGRQISLGKNCTTPEKIAGIGMLSH